MNTKPNDQKLTLLGAVLAAVIGLNVDWGKLLFDRDKVEAGKLIGAVIVAVLLYFIKPDQSGIDRHNANATEALVKGALECNSQAAERLRADINAAPGQLLIRKPEMKLKQYHGPIDPPPSTGVKWPPLVPLLIIGAFMAMVPAASAQTKLQLSQLSLPVACTSVTVPSVLVFGPSAATGATVQCIPLSSLSLGTVVKNETTIMPDPAPITLTLKNSGVISEIEVYRNGMRLAPAIDYTISGNVITFTGQVPSAKEVVLCDYRFQ